MPSPLEKYQRQPKQYIDLPSKGRWYSPGSLEKHEEIAVYSMTASDEIATKTPDALLSGNATANIIKNCIPSIRNPWEIPMVDIYTILSAIRMASYGDSISITSKCENCGEENTYEVGLQNMIGHFGDRKFVSEVQVDNMKFDLRPLNYKEFNAINKQNFHLQRRMQQVIPTIDNEDLQAEESQKIYDGLAELKTNTVISCIAKIEVDGEQETDLNAIAKFIKNADKDFFRKVEDTLVNNNSEYNVPPTDTTCSACGHQSKLDIEMDYSNFFVRG